MKEDNYFNVVTLSPDFAKLLLPGIIGDNVSSVILNTLPSDSFIDLLDYAEFLGEQAEQYFEQSEMSIDSNMNTAFFPNAPDLPEDSDNFSDVDVSDTGSELDKEDRCYVVAESILKAKHAKYRQELANVLTVSIDPPQHQELH